MGANSERNQDEKGASRIEAAVEARLRQSPELAGHPIRCTFCNGTLTLHGRVPTHFLRQTARSLAQQVEGVKVVDNRIDVVPLPVDDPRLDASRDPNHEDR